MMHAVLSYCRLVLVGLVWSWFSQVRACLGLVLFWLGLVQSGSVLFSLVLFWSCLVRPSSVLVQSGSVLVQSCSVLVWSGLVWFHLALSGSVWFSPGSVWFGLVRSSSVLGRSGSVWFHLVLSGSIWFCLALSGSVWFSVARPGSVGISLARSGSVWFSELGASWKALASSGFCGNSLPQLDRLPGIRCPALAGWRGDEGWIRERWGGGGGSCRSLAEIATASVTHNILPLF